MSDFWGSVATQSETTLDNNFFEFIAYFGVYFKAGQGRRRWCVSAKMGNVFEVWTVWVLVLSFWMRIGVLHHEEATGCVGVTTSKDYHQSSTVVRSIVRSQEEFQQRVVGLS